MPACPRLLFLSFSRRLLAPALALALTGTAQAALFDVPIPPSAYITVNGNDWAWGYPIQAAGYNLFPPADLSYQATQGWRLPTVSEMTAANLTETSFVKADGNVPLNGADPVTGTKFSGVVPAGPAACATAYFMPATAGINWCDLGNMPWAGLLGADPFNEQLFIRPVPDVAVSLTGPGTATAGSTITVTATLANPGKGPVISGSTTITLPAGLSLAPGAPLPAGCTAVGTQVTCNMAATVGATLGLGPIAANGGSVQVPLQAVVAAAPPANGTVSATASGMIRDLATGNDSATWPITFAAAPAPTAQAVPTLGEWSVALLALLTAALGWTRLGERGMRQRGE